ncbi:MAG: methyltransferase [Flavobacteriaceae bacterium]|nr:methyltransferase [Flavobacteriaceae bacterium]
MRIISGIHKGRRLMAPKHLPVRPTTDFAKEALFNILQHQIDIEEIKMLDLFSGTGNIAYEFASRGCKNITSVDQHHGCVLYIEKIATELDLPIETIKADVFQFVAKHVGSYDVIFADPPYSIDSDTIDEMVKNIFKNNLLNDEGMLIIEHSKYVDLSALDYFENARKYGGSVFSFFSVTS